jgi:hypothetical protein
MLRARERERETEANLIPCRRIPGRVRPRTREIIRALLLYREALVYIVVLGGYHVLVRSNSLTMYSLAYQHVLTGVLG